MMLITEMGLQDWRLKAIMCDYRRLCRLNETIPEGDPFRDIMSFVESLFPSYQRMLREGSMTDYTVFRELALSNAEDDDVIEMLLDKAPWPEEKTND